MYQPISLFIGLRYSYKRSTDYFSHFISWVSSIGIAIGVMALISVLSAMNGFEHELQNNTLKLIPQVIISSSIGSLNPKQFPKSIIQLRGVNCITPLTTGDVILQSSHNISVGIILGIDPMQIDSLTSYLLNVKQTDLKPGRYNIILGEQLARALNVNRGDQLRVIVPSVNQLTPIGPLPSQHLFNVIGTFYSRTEVDSYQMLINIQDASCIMHYPKGNITGWRLWLNDPLKVNSLNYQKLPKGIKCQDWRNQKGELFQAMHMEKSMMGLLLSLIIITGTFNVMSSLSMMVAEKQGEIAILKTQGLTSRQIIAIFITKGANTGIIGVLVGSVFGILLANIIKPVSIELLQVLNISFLTIFIVLLSTLYPSWKATTIQPSEVLRYE